MPSSPDPNAYQSKGQESKAELALIRRRGRPKKPYRTGTVIKQVLLAVAGLYSIK